MPEISIIIPTKDRGDIFFATLEKIVQSSQHLDVEILVINNSNKPVSIPHRYKNVFSFDNPNNKNSVFSSRNYGASIAKAPIIIFIDDDIIVTEESLEYAVQFYAKHSNACFNVNWVYPPELMEKIRKTIFGRYLIKNGFTAMKSLYDNDGSWNDTKPFISHSVASFFFCIRSDDFKRIGGYDERHLHEGTDIDISNRLNNNGIEIWINPLIMVYHNETDRTKIQNWMERKKRLGEIHGHSKNMPDIRQQLHYSFMKRIGFRLVYFMQPFLLGLIKLVNTINLDFVGFFLIDALLGANMSHGYYSVRK